MLRPLDSERNRKSSKQQDFKVPKRVIPLSQHPATPLPMSQPKKRPYQIDPRTNKKVDLEEPLTSKKVKLSDSVVAEDYLKLEPLANSLFQETINISKSPFSFGRNDTCDCEIDDDRLSKLHCVITKENDSIWLLDKSTNSCLVNNTSVGKGNKVLLRGGEILHLFFDPLSLQHIGFKVVLVDQLSGEHKSQVEALKQTSEEMNIIPLISGLSSISS